MENKFQRLTMTQRNKLLKLLHKLEEFFDWTLGTWKTDPVDFEFKKDVKPICSLPYPVPKVKDKMFKKEVERIIILWVIEVANDS